MDLGITVLAVLQIICQILFLAVPMYYLLLFLRRTRGYRVLFGIVLLLLTMVVAAKWLRMDEIGWLLSHIINFIPIALVILFQPELRRVFAEIGGHGSRAHQEVSQEDAANIVTQIAKSVESLASQRIGAILAIEQDDDLDALAIGARKLDSPVVAELLDTIFYPGTSLHDGGVIIRGSKIAYAGCIFPLGAMDDRRRAFGTRHRAAIGLTEKTDAIVIVVSEETGLVSVAYHGKLLRGLSANSLIKILQSCFSSASNESETISQVAESGAKLDPVAAAMQEIKENS